MVADYDLSSLREIFSGAAPLDAAMQLALGAQLNVTVRQGYGMTETSPIVAFSPIGKERILAGSAGLLVPNSSMKVLGPAGEELGVDEEGELCISGPQVQQISAQQTPQIGTRTDNTRHTRTIELAAGLFLASAAGISPTDSAHTTTKQHAHAPRTRSTHPPCC